jgi:hypothetical protein
MTFPPKIALLVVSGLLVGIAGGFGLGKSIFSSPSPEQISANLDTRVASPERPLASERRQPVVIDASDSAINRKPSRDGAVDKRQHFYNAGFQAADQEPEPLLASIRGVSNAGDRLEFIRGVFKKLAVDDPQFALELARELPTKGEQTHALKTLALEWAFSGQGTDTETAMLGATLALASSNPQMAAMWAQTNLEGRARGMAVTAAVAQWATKEPQAAFAWAKQLQTNEPNSWMSSRLMSRIATSAADANPNQAASILQQMEPGRGRDMAVSNLAEKWFAQDPQGAISWASQLTETSDRARATRRIASDWASADPASALNWAAGLREPNVQQDAIGAAVRSWARRDPRAAGTYAQTLPAGELRNNSLASVASVWARSDSSAATQWAGLLADPAARTAAVNAINRANDRR